MNNKIKIIALFGESGAGKDTALSLIKELDTQDKKINYIISNTTRPPRDYEQEGVDYFFTSIEDFTIKILDGSMLEAVEFNNWFYGTSLDSIKEDSLNIGVFNPAGIECLMTDSRLEVFPVRVTATDKTRLIRILNREENPDCDEILRRWPADKKDFSNFSYKYLTVNNDSNNKSVLKQELKILIDSFVQND